MITMFMRGKYKLIETKNKTKVLYLDDETFAWVELRKSWEILVTTHRLHRTDKTLSAGNYVIYDVEDEPYLTDLQHLELEYGDGAWQGYLLLTGLPDDKKKRVRIVPTNQLITGMPYFSKMISYSLKPTLHPLSKKHLVGGNV